MANYTGNTAVHQTLVAQTVDTVTLTPANAAYGEVTVVNRSGAAEIYFTVGSGSNLPATPVVAANDTYVLPASMGSFSVPWSGGSGGAVVKLISSGTPTYSVQGV